MARRPRGRNAIQSVCGHRYGGCAVNRSDKAVAAAGQRFYKTRARCGIAQCLANLVDRSIQAVVEIDERVGRPDFLPQIVAGDDLSGMLQQSRENLEGLFLEPDAGAILA